MPVTWHIEPTLALRYRSVRKKRYYSGHERVQCLTVNSSNGTQPVAAPDEKVSATTADNAPTILDGNASNSSTQSVIYNANNADIATQICNIFKKYSLHITGSINLPDGNRYDRIFNVGGGNCYFYSVCQGLEFFGISIDHVELRTKVGQWLQNPYNAHLKETH